MKRINNYLRQHYILIFLSLVVIMSTYSCSSPQTTNLLQDRKPIYPAKPFQDYRLQINDEIICTIFSNNKEFTDSFNGIVTSSFGNSGSTYTIFETGKITIPFFGEIYLQGLTIQEAEDQVQEQMRLAIPDAQVKIFLAKPTYYIVSESLKGVQQIYKDNMTIYQALAMTGIPNTDLETGKVKIIRQDLSGKSIIKQFDLRTETLIESEFYYIKPNDIIYYSTSKTAFFRINSFQSLISTLIAPISVALTILAFRIN